MIIGASDCKVHVKYRYSCQTAMNLQFSRQIFEKHSNTKLYQNLSSGSRVLPCGQTGMKKLIVTFRNVANAPKNLLFAPSYLTARLSTSHKSAPTEWILAKFHTYEGVSKSPRTMLLTRKSLVVYEFPGRVCCGVVL